MDLKLMHEQLAAATVRIDDMIFLGGSLTAPDASSSRLVEFFEEESEAKVLSCFPDMPPALREMLEPDYNDDFPAAFADWARDNHKFGFLLNVSTPKQEARKDGHMWFSWGYCWASWVYGDTLEAAVAQASAWAETRRAMEQKRK